VILDKKYPYIAPDIYLLTPNGRFKPNQKICLSATKFHQNKWQPRIKIKDILFGLKYFMNVSQKKMETMGVGGMVTSQEERKFLAKRSLVWECEACGYSFDKVKDKFILTKEDQDSEEYQAKEGDPSEEDAQIEEEVEGNLLDEKDNGNGVEEGDLVIEEEKTASNQKQHEKLIIDELMSSNISEDYLSYINNQKKLETIDQTSNIKNILKEIKEMKLVSMSVTYKDHPDLEKKIHKPLKVPFKRRLKNWVETLFFIILLVVIYLSIFHLLLGFTDGLELDTDNKFSKLWSSI
jgi:hypothetical protein